MAKSPNKVRGLIDIGEWKFLRHLTIPVFINPEDCRGEYSVSTYVYGPVPSRRLGKSLGIDLVPFKTCTYNCIYCQLGRTTHKTVQRQDWVAPDMVLEQLSIQLNKPCDTITLAGSGEPTLHSRIGEIICGIKEITDVPVAVLTNGSLLSLVDVRRDLLQADIVLPSLDAGNVTLFRHVNRPHREIRFENMVQGLVDFRSCYEGQIWLEIFLLGGVNGLPASMEEIAAIAEKICPDRIQLNTVTRPPAEPFAMQVPESLMRCLAPAFHGKAEIIADFKGNPRKEESDTSRDTVKNLIMRRPCTLEDIAWALSVRFSTAAKYVEELTAGGEIESESVGKRSYYRAVRG